MKTHLLLIAAAAFLASPAPVPAEEGEWIVVPPQSLLVDPGSPLDFSALVPNDPVGARGRVVPRGPHLVFEKDGTPARFNCAMLQTSLFQRVEFPTHAESDQLAAQMRLHGYSLVRQQYVDFRLTRHAKFDVDINPEQLDRFFYLLAALKKQNLYWMLDIVSGPGKGVRGEAWNPSSPDDLRVRMHFDPAARALWLKLLDTVFARTNPYTGMSTLADPALAFVVGANENSIAFARTDDAPFPTGFGTYFDRWVRARFPTPQALEKALPDLSTRERTGEVPIALPSGWRETGPRMALLLHYVAELEIGTNRWMSAELAKRGFRGPNLGHHDWTAASTNETRGGLPVIDIHAYGGEVTGFRPGTVFDLPSATSMLGQSLWLIPMATRHLDRPMMATEYDSPFPGPFRYEAGLFFPALAAFQGFDLICRTTMSALDPYIPDPSRSFIPLRGFSGGLDPVVRAQETLAAMLFFRGDVTPATRTIAVPFGAAEFAQPGSAWLLRGANRAALLARLGVVPEATAPSLPSATLLAPVGAVPVTLRERFVGKVIDLLTGETKQRIAKLVADLRANGTLHPDNQTDAQAGIYQSHTGELTLNQRDGRIVVATPRTVSASTTNADADISMGVLTLRSVDAGALVGATSLDGAPIGRSQKLLLVMTGNSRNTGMKLDGAGDRRIFRDWGSLPIELRRVRAALTLRTAPQRRARLTVLSLRGAKLSNIPLRADARGELEVDLDTAAIRGMPTTFYLLELD